MALTRLPVFESRNAARYTGTNSADFNNEISDFIIGAENASGLTFTSGGSSFTVAPQGYIVWYQGEVTEVFQNEQDFRDVYATPDQLASHVHDLVLTTGPARQPDAPVA